MKPVFSVVPLDPPIHRNDKAYRWGSFNRVTGRVWKSSYRVTRAGAESCCSDLNLKVEVGLICYPAYRLASTGESFDPKTLH